MQPEAAARPGPAPVAITGATGFIGRHLMGEFAGREVAALARAQGGRSLPAAPGLRWIPGDLADAGALAALVAGAGTVIHLAGATKALSRAGFFDVNATATAVLVQAAAAAGVGHFILLSSLAATRPGVSDYAASKAAGEAAARQAAGAMRLTILRAPAVFGPGDDATRPLFAMLARGWLVTPGGRAGAARFSVADVGDLARAIRLLADRGPDRDAPIAPYSAASLGWDDVAASGARVLGRPLRRIALPGPIGTMLGGAADAVAAITRRPQVFSGGKVREMKAGDWLADTPIPGATPFDATMRRCMAPFLAASVRADREQNTRRSA